MRILFFLSAILLFLGCEALTPSHSKNLASKKNTKQQIVSHMVRGVIKSQHFIKDKGNWNYKLEVIDMANEDLRYLNFNYPKKLYNVGDLIYVVFNKSDKTKIQSLYLITKSYEQESKNIQKKTKLKKRTKAQKTPWIKTPQTETIKLN